MSSFTTHVLTVDDTPRVFLGEDARPVIEFPSHDGAHGRLTVLLMDALPADQVAWLRRLSVELDELSDELNLRDLAARNEAGEPA